MRSTVRSVRMIEEEEEAMLHFGLEHALAPNAVLRIALRELVGLPNPSWVREELELRAGDPVGAAA